MDTMQNEIAEGFERVLAAACSAERIHAIEAGEDRAALWQALEDSGFTDALVAEEAGGIGLSLHNASPIMTLAGQYAVPVPLAETVMIRGVLAASGVERPAGSIAFGGTAREEGDDLVCRGVIEGGRADHLLANVRGAWRLLPTDAAMLDRDGLEAVLRLSGDGIDKTARVDPVVDPMLAEALVRALQLAGAMSAVLDRTLTFANDREQFGRPIGKFQAIQHQLSVMAEHAFAARMAADVATSREGLVLDPLRIAIAKARTGEAAAEVAAIAHSIHGAIGFTREYNLHLHTRRLHAWRRAAGADAFWQRRIGAALIAHPSGRTVDLLREATAIA